jgi:hypothetical protein
MIRNRIDLIRNRRHPNIPLVPQSTHKAISTTPARIHHRQTHRENRAKMLPERATETLDRVWMVAHWKWELDSTTPWYRRAFFKYLFRPFIHFSWQVMKIPCPKGIEIEGKKQRVLWFENGGFFSSEDQADIACIGTWHGYKDVPLDRCFPSESAQYSSLVFPRQKNPRQHRKAPTFNLVVRDRNDEEHKARTLRESLAELNRVLDR